MNGPLNVFINSPAPFEKYGYHGNYSYDIQALCLKNQLQVFLELSDEVSMKSKEF